MPWADLFFIERRYKIEAVSFKAFDETGVDWWGSDEVKVETRDAEGWTVSNEIDDVDSGDTHPFDPAKSCIVTGPDAGKHAGDSCGHDGGDDFIGQERLDFPAANFEAALPNVDDTVVESVLLLPHCDPGFMCEVTWDGRYGFTYRIALKDPLDKAVNEIHARSELGAIAAGSSRVT
jgi:hypothetical protein